MKQVFNPYLPQGEYIPDGEPYLFGDRVYVYGSHDRFGAPIFCVNDYVCWSAPVQTLPDGGHRVGEWKYEGVIYRKNQDPKNKLGVRLLFAPDVAVGTDGRYYLYYAYDFMGITGVAVADNPAGPYEYYGHVQYADGTPWGRRKGDSFTFDPGVLVDDDGSVYLYSGFYTPVPAVVTGFSKRGFDGGYVVELEQDMITIKTPEKLLFPKQGEGAFKGHEFFEASSIRKYDGKYYFVYSSRLNHELCYAVSDKPTEGFTYGGTLVSIGDIGLPGVEDEKYARNYTGNTHGGMLRLGDDFYTFYHRQTDRSSYARQACAEKLEWTRDENGTLHFQQAEITSCGLNGRPLDAQGTYEARIACNLWSKSGAGRYDEGNPKKTLKDHPYFTQNEKDGDPNATQYIANLRDHAVAGYKYFDFGKQNTVDDTLKLSVDLRVHHGDGAPKSVDGELQICTDPECTKPLVKLRVITGSREWTTVAGTGTRPTGVQPLYLTYRGTGAIDVVRFTLA